MALSKTQDRSSVNEHFVLFKACEQGDLKTLEEYVKSFSASDISLIRDEQKATLAHYAARYGHIHILEYLIEKKHLDISQLRTEHGATCAHDAAVCDQLQALNYIFHYHQLNNHNSQDSFQKLRWTVRDDQGNSPLHLAAAYGSIQTLQYLLEHESADPHIRSYNGFQPIHYAASSGHGDCAKLLLTTAPNTVNQQTSTLLTPLYLACQHGSLDTIKILSSHGANFKLRDENGLNCLHAACQSGHLPVVQWLVETQNGDVNDADYTNNTPLHYAAASGNETIITYLLEKKARVITSNDGNTPLHVAAENGQHDACAVLIERGRCSVTARNNTQLTAADVADRYGYPALANELRIHGTSPLSSESSSTNSNKIRLENATVVRLVVKKRNVERSNASSQVDEDQLIKSELFSSSKLTTERVDSHELRTRTGKHEASRNDTMSTDVLMHSMDSLNRLNKNRPHAKLPTQTYAPWLKQGNMTSQAFEQEIQKVGFNLRKVRRASLLREDNARSNEPRLRQSQSVGRPVIPAARNEETSSSSSDTDNLNNRNPSTWKRTGFQTRPPVIPISKSHQFISSSSLSSSQLNVPVWKRGVIDRRRAAPEETSSQS